MLAIPLAASARQASGLTTGFSADPVLTGSAAGASPWIGRAASEGASIVRVNLLWSNVAPAVRPPGFVASDPDSPGYDFSSVDASVRALAARGLRVLLNVSMAPPWAEAPGRPASAPAGTWEPDPEQFAQFAHAVAVRYDGAFPDPLRPGGVLPRVRYWQAWNEPNLGSYLTPQWSASGSSYVPASPAIYRQLLNRFYAAVKGVSSSNVVAMAGLAPYGDAALGGERIQPVAFDRSLFCLSVQLRSASRCGNPAHLDVAAQHLYGIGGPLWRPYSSDDVAVANMYRVADVLRAAQRTGHVLPRGRKQLWVSEISWDSSPPDPNGVPIRQQAKWLEQALYLLWRQGVDTVLWLQLADSAPIPSYAASYQGGLFFLDGQAKPAAAAFRFPFVAVHTHGGSLRVWGLSPRGGLLTVERLRAGSWKAVGRLVVRRHEVFTKTIEVRAPAVLRARVDDELSLPWTQSK
jgi:hypothetical protein